MWALSEHHWTTQSEAMAESSAPSGNTRARRQKPNHTKEFFKTSADHGFAKRVIDHKILQVFFRYHFCSGYQNVCYIDGFAGEGTYKKLVEEDFYQRTTDTDTICKYGSPLIALHNVQDTFMSIDKGMEELELEKGITKEDLLELDRNNEKLLSRLAEGRGAWKKLRPPLRVDMVLIEPNSKRLNQLKAAMKERASVDSDYDHDIMKYKPHYRCTTFAETTTELEEKILCKKKKHPITGIRQYLPIYSFIDPFGYKQIPMDIIEKYIGENKTVLINVMVGFVHRFKGMHPDHVTALFGTEEWRNVPEESEKKVTYLWYAKLYESQLKKRGAKFTLSIAMKDKWNSLRYYMIFATNELKILKEAKESFNRVTQESHSFAFSAYYVKTNRKQMVWSNDQDPNDVAQFIYEQYKGREYVPVEEIDDFVYTSDTPYVHRKEPLKILYKEGKVSYAEGCEAQMRGTFPDYKGVCLNFSQDEHEALNVRYLQNPANEKEEAKGIWHKYHGKTDIPVSAIKPKWKQSLKILLNISRVFYSPKSRSARKGCFPAHVLLNFANKGDIIDYDECSDIDIYDNDAKHEKKSEISRDISKKSKASNGQIAGRIHSQGDNKEDDMIHNSGGEDEVESEEELDEDSEEQESEEEESEEEVLNDEESGEEVLDDKESGEEVLNHEESEEEIFSEDEVLNDEESGEEVLDDEESEKVVLDDEESEKEVSDDEESEEEVLDDEESEEEVLDDEESGEEVLDDKESGEEVLSEDEVLNDEESGEEVLHDEESEDEVLDDEESDEESDEELKEPQKFDLEDEELMEEDELGSEEEEEEVPAKKYKLDRNDYTVLKNSKPKQITFSFLRHLSGKL